MIPTLKIASEWDPLLAAAYHEAGHAVTAYKLGIPLQRASTRATGDEFGSVLCAHVASPVPCPVTDALPKVYKRCRCALAGVIAQARYHRDSVKSEHGERDRDFAFQLVRQFATSTRETTAYMQLFNVQAEQLVVTNWALIKEMAESTNGWYIDLGARSLRESLGFWEDSLMREEYRRATQAR